MIIFIDKQRAESMLKFRMHTIPRLFGNMPPVGGQRAQWPRAPGRCGSGRLASARARQAAMDTTSDGSEGSPRSSASLSECVSEVLMSATVYILAENAYSFPPIFPKNDLFFPNHAYILKYGLFLHCTNTYIFIIRLIHQYNAQNTV